MAYENIMTDVAGYFTEDQLVKIERAAENLRDRILIRLLKYSGRRITEIIGRKETKLKDRTLQEVPGITPSRIMWDEEIIIYNIIKKRKPMVKRKHIDKGTLALIQDYIQLKDIQPDEPIFKITRQQAFNIIRKTCARCGIHMVGTKRPHPHHFRHSFAVQAIKSSEKASDLRTLQQDLEHSSLDMTSNYLQFDLKEQKEMHKRMWKREVKNGDDGKNDE